MREQDARALGMVYGYVHALIELRAKRDVGIFEEAARRPVSNMGEIIRKAMAFHILTQEDHDTIGSFLEGFDTASLPSKKGGSEVVQPLPIQGSWQLGAFEGERLAYERNKHKRGDQ